MNRYEDQLYKEVEKTLKLLEFEYTNLWVEETPDMFTDTRIFLIYIETINQVVYRIYFRQFMKEPITAQIKNLLEYIIDADLELYRLEFNNNKEYFECVDIRNENALLLEEEKLEKKKETQILIQKYKNELLNELIIEMKEKGEL